MNQQTKLLTLSVCRNDREIMFVTAEVRVKLETFKVQRVNAQSFWTDARYMRSVCH